MYISRRLTKHLCTYKSLHYPYKNSFKSSHRYETVIGIGGNIGDVKRRFEHLFFIFNKDIRVDVMKTSFILKNPPFGYINQNDFFNSIIVIKTSMQAKVFLNFLMRIEKNFSRKRSFKDAPRTLDLDIIFFDNRSIKTKILTVPHQAWSQRDSVVIPLVSLLG